MGGWEGHAEPAYPLGCVALLPDIGENGGATGAGHLSPKLRGTASLLTAPVTSP
jgi:hypothetical protein